MSGFGEANYQKSIEKIKEENGGKLPSDLYLQTNEQLTNLLRDLTGKFAPPRTSKKVLVARIERYTNASQESSITGKRKIDMDVNSSIPKKTKRGCLPELSAGQISEMRRVLSNNNMESYTHRELFPIWTRMGVTSQYPGRDSKSNIIEKMRQFAKRNFEYHNL